MANGGDERAYLAECYWPGVDLAQVEALARRLTSASRRSRDAGGDVAYLGSILVPGDETVFCLFDGSEPEICAVSRTAGAPVERIREAVRLDSPLPGRNR